jgi:hypothetical protein
MVNISRHQSTSKLERPKTMVTLVRNPIYACDTRDTRIMRSVILGCVGEDKAEARAAPRL